MILCCGMDPSAKLCAVVEIAGETLVRAGIGGAQSSSLKWCLRSAYWLNESEHRGQQNMDAGFYT